jgi:hypothetical protein
VAKPGATNTKEAMMWEAVASALIIHIGKTAIDKFWTNKDSSSAPVVNQNGIVSYSRKDIEGRTVIPKDLTGPRQQTGTLFGTFYYPASLQQDLVGDEVALVLVIGEDNEHVLLFEADINSGYKIDLPYGLYSVFVFVLDPSAPDLFEAEIYAVGFPNAENIDLSGIETIDVDRYDDIWSLVDTKPVRMMSSGPFYLDFILFDTEVEADLPLSFAELFEDQKEIFGYYCPRCSTHVTSISCTCGNIIEELSCGSCGAISPVSDICPNCYADITSLQCPRCRRTINSLVCPTCRTLIPV